MLMVRLRTAPWDKVRKCIMEQLRQSNEGISYAFMLSSKHMKLISQKNFNLMV